MMNRKSIEMIKEAYRPLKVTMKGNVEILQTTSGNIVIKEKKNNIRKLYDYLNSRSFNAFPPLVDDSKEGVNIFSYVKDSDAPKEQKAMDLIKLIALLHQKTTYYKDVTSDEYKKIYENLKDQISYYRYFFEEIYNESFHSIYPSPSEYLLLTNISKIIAALNFSEQKLEEWYEEVHELTRYRVCQIHNHLCLEHMHDNCLLSWENSKKDSPVLDLVNFYKNCYFDLNFSVLLEEYFRLCPWSKEEKDLFFITISIPPKFELKGSEFTKVKNIRVTLDYIYKTENLIRPYNTIEQEKQQRNFNQ